MIPQDPILLPCTLREHLSHDTDSPLSDTDIYSVLEKVNLARIVRSLGGLDIDASDMNLSHGQQQLFMLAIAILRRRRIVVLDEVTSGLDRGTEEDVKRVLDKEFRDRTVTVVAHKDGALRGVDQVIQMSLGRIQEVRVY